MIKVDIMRTRLHKDARIICTLGWDAEKEEIVFLKGKAYAERMKEFSYLDKRNMERITFADGLKFIMNLPYALTGSRIFASAPYNE